MLMSPAFIINLCLAVGLLLFAREFSAQRPLLRSLGVLMMLVFTALYVGWRFNETLPKFSWRLESLWPWLFFAGEASLIAYEAWSWLVLRRLSNHSPQADIYEERMRQEPALPSVDVFVPTYSEGPEILTATIRGAQALDYKGEVKVWILDDKRRPWLKELCAEMNAGYIARPTNEHGKAGNLNYAFPRTSGEFLLVIDADFVLEKNFLYRTMGFLLYDKKVALVQTPQHFHNPDPVQHNLFGAGAWTEEQNFFMTVVQSGRDVHENAFCVGSGWVIRRSLLEELGGFPQQSICEDLEISYVLKGRGQRTLFLNEALAWGLAPESVAEYIKQRVRWCCGTLQHVFLKSGPLRAPGLTWRDRLFYFEPIVFWLTYPLVLLVFAAPLVFWFAGLSAMKNADEGFAYVLLPRLIVVYTVMYWLSGGKVLPVVSTVHKVLPAFHLSAEVSKFFFAPFGRPFNVTAKGHRRDRAVIQWSLLHIYLAVAVLLCAGMFMNLSGICEVVKLNQVTSFDIAWTMFSLIVLGLCMLACVEMPRQARNDPASEVARCNPVGAVKALLIRLFA